MKMTAEETILRKMGAEFQPLDAGCCGMAGPFGFAADKSEDVFAILDRLLKRDPEILAAAGTATEQARGIFAPPSPGEGRTLPQAVVEALDESFAEIGASGRASLRTCSSMDDGSLVCPLPENECRNGQRMN